MLYIRFSRKQYLVLIILLVFPLRSLRLSEINNFLIPPFYKVEHPEYFLGSGHGGFYYKIYRI